MKRVQFLRSAGVYQTGEIAVFEDDHADMLVFNRAAEEIPMPTTESKEEQTTEPEEESTVEGTAESTGSAVKQRRTTDSRSQPPGQQGKIRRRTK